jgi:hypothetical protein
MSSHKNGADGESNENQTAANSAEASGHQQEHESVDAATRRKVLEENDHRCRLCGADGAAQLQVHHIERDPDGMDEHAMANLTLLCWRCHNWQHLQTTASEVPVDITEADQSHLLAHDLEIIQYFWQNGPARTGEVAEALTADLTLMAVRQRLYLLMALDNIVAERDTQLVDKDVETGRWGLTEQIETSARGHIPDDPQTLIKRVEDEQVRQAIDRGCSRSAVADVLGVAERTARNKQRRAQAHDFPLDAVQRTGEAETAAEAPSQEVGESSHETDGQQPHGKSSDDAETAIESAPDTSGQKSEDTADTTGSDPDAGDAEMTAAVEADDGDAEVQAKLSQAIEALETIQDAV